MKLIALTLALATPVLASAQPSGAFKLVLSWAQGGVAVIDYPSAARCEAAKKVIDEDAARKMQEAQARARETGGTIVGAPWRIYAICIPT